MKQMSLKKKVLISFAVVLVIAALSIGFLFFVNHWQVNLMLQGEPDISVEYGSDYEDQGAVATFGGTLILKEAFPEEVQVSGSVDTHKLGEYTMSYHAERWWYESDITRTVHVVDTTPPALTLVADPEHYTLPGHPYEEEGYQAVDAVDGDLTELVQREEKEGRVYYSVTDKSGNIAKEERQIRYDDPIPPELSLAGETDMYIKAGSTFSDPGYSAIDNCDGDLTGKVSVSGSVDTFIAGEYDITYTVEDNYHNQVSAVRHVTVEAVKQPSEVYPGDKTVYLTFDDGPGPYTQQLLDVLAKYNVKATFFVVDTGYSSLIAQEAAAGHSVGIHSATHNYSNIYASEEAYFADLQNMKSIIQSQTGQGTTLLRFPGGSSNMVSSFNPGIMTRLTQAVTDQGYQYFDWNVLSGDAGETTDTEQVFKNVIDGIQSHNVSVVLQHDIKGFSVAAVEKIIIWGLGHGYTFLPLTSESPTAHHPVNN